VTPGRLLGAVVAALVLAAAALWGASRGTWLTVDWDTPLRGRVVATATGAETEPVLVPWALLALAAVAGVLATSGWWRRVVGSLIAVAGVWALLRAVTGLAAPPADAVPVAARQAGRVAGVAVHPAWPVLAAVGAALLLAAGAITALRAPELPRLGGRYDAPGTTGARRRPVDPDQAMWEALDAGHDPTLAPEVSDPVPDAPPGRSATVDHTTDLPTDHSAERGRSPRPDGAG
jgi:uncharacterized membrane protein (TIGR02234 family)